MGMNLYQYMGIYFEVDKKTIPEKVLYVCSQNEKHYKKNYKEKVNFCSKCGAKVEKKIEKGQERYLTQTEIEQESGIEGDFFLGKFGLEEEKIGNFFGINNNYENVFFKEITDYFDNGFIQLDLNKTPQDYINEALENEDFKKEVLKLKETYKDNFKIHFGVFYTYM